MGSDNQQISPEEMADRMDAMLGVAQPGAAARASSPPETAAIRHGGYIRGIMRCSRKFPCWDCCDRRVEGQACPIEIEWAIAERARIVREMTECGLDPERYGRLVDDAIRTGLRCERLQCYEQVMGSIHPGAALEGVLALQPAVAALPGMQRMWRSALEAIGLTPASIKALSDEREADAVGAFFSRLSGARPRALAAGEAIDAEVVESEGDGDGLRQQDPAAPEQDGTTTAQDTANDNGPGGDGDDNDENGG